MYFSESTGALVCGGQHVPPEVFGKLVQYVPGDDPYRDFRSLVVLRGDTSMTFPELLEEFAKWVDLFGYVRKSGRSVDDIREDFRKRFESGRGGEVSFTLRRATRKNVPQGDSRPNGFSLEFLEDGRDEEVPDSENPFLGKTSNGVASKKKATSRGKSKAKKGASTSKSKQRSVSSSRSLLGRKVRQVNSGREGMVVKECEMARGFFSVRWKSGSSQSLSVKTLKDRRRYVLS